MLPKFLTKWGGGGGGGWAGGGGGGLGLDWSFLSLSSKPALVYNLAAGERKRYLRLISELTESQLVSSRQVS